MRTITFSPPDITDNEINAVVETLKSGWITTGPKTKELERRIASYCNTNKATCLNSQTASAEMALRLLGIGPGDEVITSAYTYTATAEVIAHVGAKIVLVDTNKDSFEMDYDQLEAAINSRTKAVIPVDIGGVPCNYDRIVNIVEEKRRLFKANGELQEALGRVAICEDAAHAFGARYKEKNVGSIADFTSFSFHAVKNLTTAEGGALTWKGLSEMDDDIYKKIQLMSLHGQSKDALSKTNSGSWEYDVVGTWYKCNMTDIMASIGLSQLDRYEELLKRRKVIIEYYDDAFKDTGLFTLNHFTNDYSSSGHLYITRVPGIDSYARNEIISKMHSQGIATNVHFKPLPLMTAYKHLGFDISRYPNAYDMFKNEITLPLHTKLSDADVEYIIEKYKRIISAYF